MPVEENRRSFYDGHDFVTTWIAFKLINRLVPIRVSRDEELVGLDVVIHGIPAYSQEHNSIELNQLTLDKR
ncbi:ammonium transporter [Paenibacillus tyrfis]|uniref:ammonium transporter n=1 Tax=Paenibacillus tyrfis TaxID=1501230 RepID=UPI000B58857A|nr:ammonium transporter [Paenibacillus tyrfis]